MRFLFALLLVGVLAVPAAAQAESNAQATVIFYSASPSAGGRVVATTALTTAATADTEGAPYANLRMRSASFIFVVAKAAARGRPVGETSVRLNGGTRTLASIAADLQTGLAGTAAILVFTKASGSSAQAGEAVAVINGTSTSASARIDISGATHVTLIANGEVQVFTVVRSGTTLGSIQIQTSGEAQTTIGAAAGGGVSTIAEVLGEIGIKIGD